MTLKSIGRTMTRRTVWLLLALALVLALALSACGGRGGLGAGGNRGGNAGSTGGQSASVTQVTQSDDDLNAVMSALDSANQDMNIDDSGQDSEVMP